MFGYVTICKNSLSKEGYDTFKSYYCGLCRAIGKQCSQSARMGLSYDITFLAIVLSSINKDSSSMKDMRCIIHPTRSERCVENDKAVDYAADMGVILTYLKLLDDWHDDRSIKALFSIFLFIRGVKKAKRRYPRQYKKIREYLESLSRLEEEKCQAIDETADCFAKILSILFTPDFVESTNTKRALSWLGYNIGRWIYILDSYNDLDKDIRKKSYNTFAEKYSGKTSSEIKSEIRKSLDVSMTFTLENAASAYNLLEVYSNKEVLDNIIYTALKVKQNYILGENNEPL